MVRLKYGVAFTRGAQAQSADPRIAAGHCVEGYGSKEACYHMLEAIAGLCRGRGGNSIAQIIAAHAPVWLV